MDALRHFQHAQTFRLLAQDLAGRADGRASRRSPVGAGRHHPRRRLRELLGADWRGHDARAAALRHRSATASWAARSSATRPISISCSSTTTPTTISAPERYRELAQRLITWLTSNTPAGALYDTDLRLRPDGAKGLVVSSLRGVPALPARARVDVGAPGADARAFRRRRRGARRARSRRSADAILRLPRDRRQRSRATWSTCASGCTPDIRIAAALFDLKHDAGGMVDVEFAVQYLVLAHAHRHPELTRNARQHRAPRDRGDGLGLMHARPGASSRPTPIAHYRRAAAQAAPDRARRMRASTPAARRRTARAISKRSGGTVFGAPGPRPAGRHRLKSALSARGRRSHVDGRPRRLDLVRRQAGAVARRHDPRAHPHAALRHGRVRGRTRVQDGAGHGDLPPARAHRRACSARRTSSA